MSKVYIHIANMLLKKLRNDYHNKKRVLAKKNIKIVKWERVSEYFSDVTVTSSGNDEVFRCAKQALKTQVEEIIMEHLKSHSLEK
ncbi:aconitate hydratase [Lysinibacillus sphaericus]|uniref:aconitate hydratase n=1 Tax=Lysinibacillus sphaericus TaxID=1421 RepID=UPI003F7A33F1